MFVLIANAVIVYCPTELFFVAKYATPSAVPVSATAGIEQRNIKMKRQVFLLKARL